MNESDLEGLASHMRTPEIRQRFTASKDGKFIDDDDFIFDALIKISGDFSDKDRVRYAQWIANVLNEADKSLPRLEQPSSARPST